jgi:hypothetical protein
VAADDANLLREALYEVTGRRLGLAFAVGENGGEAPHAPQHAPADAADLYELMKETFDARDVDE